MALLSLLAVSLALQGRVAAAAAVGGGTARVFGPGCDSGSEAGSTCEEPAGLMQLSKPPGAWAPSRASVQGPRDLFRWYGRQCDPGYDYCGWLEFCSEEAANRTKFGYRLPGVTSCEIADAPLIRMVPGKKYQLTLRNRNEAASGRSSETNVHTHGLHIGGDGNADDMTRFVEAGNCLKYNWTISDDHMGGTFWYHPHRHTLTEDQLAGGAFGMIIIEEQKQLLKDLRRLERREVQAWLDNELLLVAFVTGENGEVLGNGKPQEVFDIVQHEWYRLRVAAVNPAARTRNLVIHPSGSACEVRAVAYDGVWRFTVPHFASKLVYPLTGASRIDLAVRCSGSQPVHITYDDDVAAVLHLVDGKATVATPFAKGNRQWYPDRPEYLRDLTTLSSTQANKFLVFLEGGRGNRTGPHFINNLTWDKDEAIASFSFNELQEWTLRNSVAHPFHLHIYHQQLIEGCAGHHEVGQYFDTISASGTEDCKVRFVTKDFGGRAVFHCHVLRHSDLGMMNWVDITGGPEPGNIDVEQVSCTAPPCRETGSHCLFDKQCCAGSCQSRRCQV